MRSCRQRSSGVFSKGRKRRRVSSNHRQAASKQGRHTRSVEHEDHVLAKRLARPETAHEDDEHAILTLRLRRRLGHRLRRAVRSVVRDLTAGMRLDGAMRLMGGRSEGGHHELLVERDLMGDHKRGVSWHAALVGWSGGREAAPAA
jgi:hypothetical protein